MTQQLLCKKENNNNKLKTHVDHFYSANLKVTTGDIYLRKDQVPLSIASRLAVSLPPTLFESSSTSSSSPFFFVAVGNPVIVVANTFVFPT